MADNGLSEQIRQRMIERFTAEQQAYLHQLQTGMAALKAADGTAQPALLKRLHRDAHSLKGGARAVGFIAIESLGQMMESLFFRVQNGKLPLTSDLIQLLEEGFAAVQLMLDRLGKGQTSAPVQALSVMSRMEDLLTKSAENSVTVENSTTTADSVAESG